MLLYFTLLGYMAAKWLDTQAINHIKTITLYGQIKLSKQYITNDFLKRLVRNRGSAKVTVSCERVTTDVALRLRGSS